MVSKNLSVYLSVVNFDPNYLKTGWTEWVEKKIWDFYKRLFDLSSNQNQKLFEKKVSTLAAKVGTHKHATNSLEMKILN